MSKSAQNELIYKSFVTILMGLLCLSGSLYSLRHPNAIPDIGILLGAVFPLLLSITWGFPFGLAACLIGYAPFFPLLQNSAGNWETVLNLGFLFLMTAAHGFHSKIKVKTAKSVSFQLFAVQLLFAVVSLLSALPAVLYYDSKAGEMAGRLLSYVFSENLLLLFLALLCDTLLLMPVVRRIFDRQDFSKEALQTGRYTTRIIVCCTAAGLLLSLLASFLNRSQSAVGFPHGIAILQNSLGGIFTGIAGGNLAARACRYHLAVREKIDEEELRYESIFQSIYDICAVTNIDGTILTISPSVENFLGYSTADLVGTSIIKLYYSPDERKAMVDELLKRKEISNYPITLKRSDGKRQYYWYNARLIVYRHSDCRIVFVARDVTEYIETKNRQQETERQYEQLFMKMLNGFFVVEPVYDNNTALTDLRFITRNPRFCEFCPIVNTDVIGKTWLEVYGFPNGELALYEKVLKTGESVRFESFNPLCGQYYTASAFLVSDGRIGVIFDNITKRILAEKNVAKKTEEISALNAGLEKRIQERTKELQESVRELESFSYTVSHDLKSPLRAVDSYARLIHDHVDIEANTSHIRKICAEMTAMIEKLLKYSTASKQAVRMERINIRTLTDSVYKELKANNPDHPSLLEYETGFPPVHADKVLMRQALYNILSNSLKFSASRDISKIAAGCRAEGGEYIFYFKDNGIGFDMQYAHKLFGLFERLHPDDKFEGSGIGLATVKKIVQRHGGRTWMEGKTGEGAVLYFTLPIEEQEAE